MTVVITLPIHFI